MALKKALLAIGCLLLLSGCAVTDIAQDQYVAIRNYTVGEYYLDNQKYREGITTFKAEVRRNPTDARAHYYLGRCYLAEDEARPALAALKEAVRLDPGRADHHFWLGVAYAANQNPKAERNSYETALAIDPEHVQALVYLGNNRYEAKDYRKALGYYDRALTIAPDDYQALYNRGLIYRRYKRTPEELQAWRIFLATYPRGSHARQAADFLNGHGVFDYRNHLIGIRTVTLRKITFVPLTAELDKTSRQTLDFIGQVFEKQTRFELHILAYQQNNKALAKARAGSIKRYLTKNFRQIAPQRVRISWFDVPETITVGKQRHRERNSINFFTRKRKR